jgi:hypothetical protein
LPLIFSSQVGLHPFRQLTASQQDAMTAAFAFKAYIGAEAHYHPFVRTTWMRFPQTKQIIELKIGKHDSISD